VTLIVPFFTFEYVHAMSSPGCRSMIATPCAGSDAMTDPPVQATSTRRQPGTAA